METDDEKFIEDYCVAGYWSTTRKDSVDGYSIKPVGVVIAFRIIDGYDPGSATFKTFEVSYQESDPIDT